MVLKKLALEIKKLLLGEKGKKNKAQYHKAFKSHEYELNTPHISLLWVWPISKELHMLLVVCFVFFWASILLFSFLYLQFYF